MKLEGKQALVTGAGVRVGRAIALALGRSGCDVCVHYRTSAAEADSVVAELEAMGRRALAVAAELRDPHECRRLIERCESDLGGLDILVNNAASFVRNEFEGASDQDWEQAWNAALATNLVAPARLVRLAAPLLRCRAGVVINLHDIAGEFCWPGHVQHGAAKAGLRHLTSMLATALGPEIRVNGVMPGIAMFPEGADAVQKRRQIDQTLLRRPGSAEDIADAVVFVASAEYMTGAHVPVDGGWSVHGTGDDL